MAKSRKPALGRGLDAILGEVEKAYENSISSTSETESVIEIEISKITPNPYQPRKVFKDSSLQELADSIKEYGVLQPILVYQEDDGYVLIAGERRLRAGKIAGLEKIKAIIAKIDLQKLREVALIENIQREDLNPIDLAKAYQELLEVYHLTHDELGMRLQKSRAQVSNTLRLLNLSSSVQEMLIGEKITQGHAKILIALPIDEQERVAKSIVGQRLSVRASEDLVKSLKNKSEKPKKDKVCIDFSVTADTIKKEMSKHRFVFSLKGNKLTVTFKNENEMKRFLELL